MQRQSLRSVRRMDPWMGLARSWAAVAAAMSAQCIPCLAHAQLPNPLSLIGKAVTTAADVRTREEVKNVMGVARTREEVALAEKEAKSVDGVKSVRSHLRILARR